MDSTIRGSWRRLLIDLEFARNYPIARVSLGPPFRNPILEAMLPSLLHMKAVTILDEALKKISAQKGLRSRNSLNARIELLSTERILSTSNGLHAVRGRRNDLAHEFEEAIDWVQLDRDIQEIQSALEHLGVEAMATSLLVGFGEHVAARLQAETTREYEPRLATVDGNSIYLPSYWRAWVSSTVRLGD